MKRILSLFIVSLFANYFYAQDVTQSERNALIDFYDNTNGNNWANKTNWKSSLPVKDWYGITTSSELGIAGEEHVIDITLIQNGISGKLISTIGNLTFLEGLNLSYNFISGSIPNEIGNLTNIKKINLSRNSQGSSNGFTGVIPTTIGNLINLEELNLAFNSFTGGLPSEITNLTKLITLDLFPNKKLGGQIPAGIGNLTNLKNLNLSLCSLIGNIPSSFSNLQNLENVAIASNSLSGNIKNFFSNSLNLQKLDISSNYFSGDLDLRNNKKLINFTYSYYNTFNVILLDNTSNSILTTKGFGVPIKCMSVDNPTNAQNATSPYNNWTINWFNNTTNFQTDCSAYLTTAENKNYSIKVFPNPVQNILNIKTTDKIERGEVYTISGQKIKNFNNKEINVSDLQKGIYILQIVVGDKTITQKFIKE